MKKILSFVLVLVICLALGITAFAVDPEDPDHTHKDEGYCDCGGVVVNEKNFPDQNFMAEVKKLDGGNDGFFTAEELAAIETINVKNKKISNLKGVEFFTAVTNLNCNENSLTELDVSKNTELVTLTCNKNNLTKLVIGENTNLKTLQCFNNQLETIDLSKNTALKNISCSNNKLTQLDVSENLNLTDLTCAGNLLTELDVAKNSKLQELNCYSNKLTALDVTKNPDLDVLHCENNQLTELDVKSNSKLLRLFCNENQITSLDISKNDKLVQLACQDNKLTTLDISNNKALYDLGCGSNELAELNIDNNTELENVSCNNNKLTALNLKNNTILETLDCSGNLLESLDVSVNTALKEIVCNSNKLKELSFTSNLALTEIECDDNLLESLDISKNTALKSLSCKNNKLSELNVKNNTAMTNLYCNNNNLTEIDVSENKKLKYFGCSDNNLTTLNVEKNTELYNLNCSNNELKKLDFTSNSKLKYLYCKDNHLTSLNLTGTVVSTLEANNQDVNITIDQDTMTFDMATLDQNFDSNKATVSTEECYFNGTTLTVAEGISEVEYTYDTGKTKKTMKVVLTITNPKIHTHSWSGDWSSNEEAHWHECVTEDCGITDYSVVEESGYTTHNAPKDDGNCATEIKCDICGYVFVAKKEHSYVYTAEDNVITEKCANDGCTAHTANAVISAPTGSLVYDGRTEFRATVTYDDNWAGDRPDVVYSEETPANLKKAGTYTASITVNGETASVTYTVKRKTLGRFDTACNHDFDKNGKCRECGIVVTYNNGYSEKPDGETNPNTGAKNTVGIAAAITAISFVGALLNKKK